MSRLGKELIEGMQEAVAYAGGRKRGARTHWSRCRMSAPSAAVRSQGARGCVLSVPDGFRRLRINESEANMSDNQPRRGDAATLWERAAKVRELESRKERRRTAGA
jgi:hypothetical protein